MKNRFTVVDDDSTYNKLLNEAEYGFSESSDSDLDDCDVPPPSYEQAMNDPVPGHAASSPKADEMPKAPGGPVKQKSTLKGEEKSPPVSSDDEIFEVHYPQDELKKRPIEKEQKIASVEDKEDKDDLDDEKDRKSDKPSLEENSHFESHLAITLSQRKDLFPVLQKISDGIIYTIDKYRDRLNSFLKLKPIFEDVYYSLYSDDFGVLGDIKGKKKTPDQMLNDIRNALMDKNKLLVNIIPIQFIFIHRLFVLAAYDKHENLFRVNTHFKNVDRYLKETKAHVHRELNEYKVKFTNQMGLSRFPNVCKKINELPEAQELKKMLHAPDFKTSFERFTINPGDKLHKFYKNNAPLVAGPSTHTYAKITGIKTFMPNLTEEEIKEYACAYFVFTGCAGYHTFHEVMSIASKCNNRPYDMSNYFDNLPENLKKSDYIAELKKLFPKQLTPAAKPYTGKPDPTLFAADSEEPIKQTPSRVRFLVEDQKEDGGKLQSKRRGR